ncbi:MAG: glutamate--tRNA ligase family protein [Candidatus Nanopelagicales bacterium]|nr:glutamate--tRNA ligase family protein [Candidatus Nanopelagicales bacterium]
MRTRFAPTPSGYLHLGNLVNARIASGLAAHHGGSLALRIDQDDRERCRTEYTAYVFEALAELGIAWHAGPRTPADAAAVDLDARTQYLRSELALLPKDAVFACTCTRTSLIERACACRGRQLDLAPGATTLRLHLPRALAFVRDGRTVRLRDELGDPVLWRRDDLPAYHWATVIDDRDLCITHVVRGTDLVAASVLHRHIAGLIGAHDLAAARFLHHPLVQDASGAKLSKSAQVIARPPVLTREDCATVDALATRLAAGMLET